MKNKRNINIDGDNNTGDLGDQEIQSHDTGGNLNLENSETIDISGNGNSIVLGGQKIYSGASSQLKTNRKTILFLSAQPHSTATLQMDREFRSMQQALSQAQEQFQLEACWAMQPADLLKALGQHSPAILHFSGHGDANARLGIEDASRGFLGLSGLVLKEILETQTSNVEGVFLNACHSAPLAKSLLPQLDWAIGMEGPVLDSDALHFSEGFYSGLAQGNSVENAFAFGKNLAQMHRKAPINGIHLFLL